MSNTVQNDTSNIETPALADFTTLNAEIPNNTTVVVDLCELAIGLQIEDPDGDTQTYQLDVPTAYRLGAGLIKAAEQLATYCAWESRGEEKDSRYSLPDDADFGCTHGAIWKRDCADCNR